MKKGNLDQIEGMYDYVLENSLRDTDLLRRLRIETEKEPLAIMQVPPEQGQLMAFLVRLIGARRTIEVGVFTGYSTLCIAQAMPDDSYTVACDISEEWTAVAQKYWREAGVDQKIDLRLAPAADTLRALIDDGQSESYDFVFIDADKESYDDYYELSLQLLRKGGLMAIDNVLLYGAVIDPGVLDETLRDAFSDQSIQAVRDLNAKIKTDQRVDMSLLQIADGITLVCKK